MESPATGADIRPGSALPLPWPCILQCLAALSPWRGTKDSEHPAVTPVSPYQRPFSGVLSPGPLRLGLANSPTPGSVPAAVSHRARCSAALSAKRPSFALKQVWEKDQAGDSVCIWLAINNCTELRPWPNIREMPCFDARALITSERLCKKRGRKNCDCKHY